MKLTRKIATATMVALLSSTSLAAYAATEAAPGYRTQPGMLQTADEAATALAQIHAARVALFDNDIETAKSQLGEARSHFLDAEKKFNDITIGDTENPESADRYLPFDVSVALDEDFVVTPENKTALDTANQQVRNGDKDSAIETLNLARIDANLSAALLPVADVTTHLDKAQTFMDEGKYFDANVALKAVEDSILIRSYTIDAIPQQGTPATN
ncbi:MAG: YfdX family protein [Paracoccaceae bacterium]